MGLSPCRTVSHSTVTRTMNHTDYNRIYFLPHIMSRFETCTVQLACLRSPRGTFIPSILWAQKPRPATRVHVWGEMPSLGKAAQENSRDAIKYAFSVYAIILPQCLEPIHIKITVGAGAQDKHTRKGASNTSPPSWPPEAHGRPHDTN